MQDQSFAAESTQFYPFAFLNSNKHGTHKVYTATQKNTNRENKEIHKQKGTTCC